VAAGHDVRPEKWSDVADLFDDGEYSAIWGRYNSGRKCLGVRWNGEEDEVGYPSQGGNPLWFVEPSYLTEHILHALLTIALSKKRPHDPHITNLRAALAEIADPSRNQ
jgi:hypothetical protein